MPANNIKLEIGCGRHKAEGWVGIDQQVSAEGTIGVMLRKVRE